MVKVYKMRTDRDDFYNMYLEIISPSLPETITNSERALLAEFMSSGFSGDRFSTASKRNVINIFKEREGKTMTMNHINVVLSTLTRKGLLHKDELGRLLLNERIEKDVKGNSIYDDNKTTVIFDFNINDDG